MRDAYTMNTTPTDEVVLKQDVLGRVKTPKAHREELLDEYERSGLPGLKFAELAGIKYPTFATWAQKRQRQRGLNYKSIGNLAEIWCGVIAICYSKLLRYNIPI
jgi:hypothetical protein